MEAKQDEGIARRGARWGRPAALLVVGVVAGALAFGGQATTAQSEGDAEAAGPARVEAAAVEATERAPEERLIGVVQARSRARLAFTVGGRLEVRSVGIGDRVTRGQRLAVVDARGFRNAVRAAQASLTELDARQSQLERDRNRARALFDDGVATDQTLEQATNGVDRATAAREAAVAELAESRRQAGETTLRAPFDGVVTDVFAEVGELVSPGQPIVHVAGNDGFEVVVEATGEIAGQLAPGGDVTVAAVGVESDDPLASATLSGRIRSVVTAAAGRGGLHPVRIDLSDTGGLRAGLGVEVTLRGAGQPVLTIPLDAVLDPSGRRPFAWRLADDRVERAWLRLGRLYESQVEVREGLTADDRVVVRGQGRLLDGDSVELVDSGTSAGSDR